MVNGMNGGNYYVASCTANIIVCFFQVAASPRSAITFLRS